MKTALEVPSVAERRGFTAHSSLFLSPSDRGDTATDSDRGQVGHSGSSGVGRADCRGGESRERTCLAAPDRDADADVRRGTDRGSVAVWVPQCSLKR